MPVNLSIKNVPDELARRLRQRAKRHHRSLQGELMAILEAAVQAPELMTPAQVLARVHEMDLSSPDEATKMVREDRDDR